MPPPNAFDDVMALVRLVTDVEAFKTRIAKLHDTMDEVDAKINEHAELVKETEAKLAEVNKIHAHGEGLVKDAERWSGQLNAMKKALDEREGVIVDRERATRKLESDVKFREAQLGERENTLDHRESVLDQRAADAAKKLADAEALLASYDQAKHEAALKLAS
jgi:chaperonin cofactor prefoldin